MKHSSIAPLKLRRFDITTTFHIYCLSMINTTVLALWKNSFLALHQLAVDGSASSNNLWKIISATDLDNLC
jgi:hypothetical protein